MAKIRFQPQEVDNLPLSDGDWVIVKRDLNNGDYKNLMRAGRLAPIVSDGRVVFPIDAEEYEIERDIIYLVGWSLLGPDSKSKMPITRDALRAMNTADYEELHTTITIHIMERAAAKKAEREKQNQIKAAETGSPLPQSIIESLAAPISS